MMFKAGTFKKQYQYKSFLPALLEKPFEWQSDAVLELLSDASRYIGELNSYTDLVPDVIFFIEMHKVKKATANRMIAALEKIGILQEKTGYSRNRLYALHKYLEIFRQ